MRVTDALPALSDVGHRTDWSLRMASGATAARSDRMGRDDSRFERA